MTHAFLPSQYIQAQPPSPVPPGQSPEDVQILRPAAEMSSEPDGEQITPCGTFRHMEFLRDDGGAADFVVVKHSVSGPAFRFPAGPVRQKDHSPERFGTRHIVPFPRRGILFRLAKYLVHADPLIGSDFFDVFTHDDICIFPSVLMRAAL